MNASNIDLRGKVVHLTNTHVRPRASNNCLATQVSSTNLSGRIKIVTRPLRAGGFCDVYQGELTRERDAAFVKPVRVAMKLLRLFNTELEDHLIKAKAVCVTASFCIHTIRLSLSLGIPQGGQHLALSPPSSRAPVFRDLRA